MHNKTIIFNILLSVQCMLFWSCSKSHDQHSHNDHQHDTEHTDAHDNVTTTDQHIHNANSKTNHKSQNKDSHHQEAVNAGNKMAVIKADKNAGIQLSKEAVIALDIKTTPLVHYHSTRNSYYSIPKESLVFYEDKTIIYVKRNKWFTPVSAKIINSKNKMSTVRLEKALARDLLVTGGVPLLRLAYLEAFGASGHGHGH